MFPRCSRQVFLKLVDARSWQDPAAVAVFELPHPIPGEHPQWQPEPYPITRDVDVGDVQFTVLSVEQTFGLGFVNSTAEFRCEDPERPGSRCAPTHITASDATGNMVTSPTGIDPQTGKAWFNGFCARKDAWKLAVQFAQTRGTSASPDLRWDLRSVPIPPFPTRQPLQVRAADRGVELRMVAASTNTSTNNRRGERVVLARFEMTAAAPREGFRLILKQAYGYRSRSAEFLAKPRGTPP